MPDFEDIGYLNGNERLNSIQIFGVSRFIPSDMIVKVDFTVAVYRERESNHAALCAPVSVCTDPAARVSI